MFAMDKFERFETWLRDNGAYFEKLELREYPLCALKTAKLPDNLSSSHSSHGQQSNDEDEGEEKKESAADAPNQRILVEDEDKSEMRGVFCKSTLAPNTVCMAVPRKCLITVEMGQATSIGQQILNADLDLDAPKHIFLMIFILQDRRNPNSFFKPYYDVLPKKLSMPIFWSEEDLKYLEGSYLLHQIADRIDAIEEDYKAICEVCPQLGEIATLEEFKWARMCVCSRNFGLQIDGSRTSAMVPHADMLNHYRPRETKWTFDDERQAFTITTLQTIQARSEIFDSYGQKCNHRFLLNYGFAVEQNVETDGFCPNEVPLEVTLSEADILFERKLDFWCREDSPQIKRVRVCVSNNENTKILFSMIRVSVADEKDLESIISSSDISGYANTSGLGAATLRNNSALHMALAYRTCRDIRFPISMRNEKGMLLHLLYVVRLALSNYPTTMAQDRESLSDEISLPQFSNRRHAIIQVLGEKEVLHYFEDFALSALQLIDITDDDHFEAALKSLEGVKHFQILRYCADSIGSLRRREQKRSRMDR